MSKYSYQDGAVSGRGVGRKGYLVYDKNSFKYLGRIEGKTGSWRIEGYKNSAEHHGAPSYKTRDEAVEAMVGS